MRSRGDLCHFTPTRIRNWDVWSRHSLFDISAHFFRAMQSGGNAQPNARARVRTPAILRLSAAEALMIEAPWDANALLNGPWLNQRAHFKGRSPWCRP
jgi:hypothetical protein